LGHHCFKLAATLSPSRLACFSIYQNRAVGKTLFLIIIYVAVSNLAALALPMIAILILA
jgi:hypothetical protein